LLQQLDVSDAAHPEVDDPRTNCFESADH
jgi:hypothetical protein